jgi:hypothetical protein
MAGYDLPDLKHLLFFYVAATAAQNDYVLRGILIFGVPNHATHNIRCKRKKPVGSLYH